MDEIDSLTGLLCSGEARMHTVALVRKIDIVSGMESHDCKRRKNMASCRIIPQLAFSGFCRVWQRVGNMSNCWACAVTVFLNKMQNRSCIFYCPMLLYTQMNLQKLQEEDVLHCGNGSLPALRRGSIPGSNCTGGANCPAPPGQCDRVPVSDTQSS